MIETQRFTNQIPGSCFGFLEKPDIGFVSGFTVGNGVLLKKFYYLVGVVSSGEELPYTKNGGCSSGIPFKD